jgi:hypothetical protein
LIIFSLVPAYFFDTIDELWNFVEINTLEELNEFEENKVK